jgi:hypothetical protein
MIVVASVIAARLPFIGKILRASNTMVHESGHAFMALFTSGKVVSVELFQDTSGAATTFNSNWFSRVLTSLSGYIFSSLSAFILFYLLKQNHPDIILYILLSLGIINLIFWVRNMYGVLWIVGFSGLTSYILFNHLEKLIYIEAVIFASVILAESVYTAVLVFILSLKSPENSGDAKNLKESTYVPAFFWGLFFMSQALYFAYQVIELFWENN